MAKRGIYLLFDDDEIPMVSAAIEAGQGPKVGGLYRAYLYAMIAAQRSVLDGTRVLVNREFRKRVILQIEERLRQEREDEDFVMALVA